MQLANYMVNLCFHNCWFTILGVLVLHGLNSMKFCLKNVKNNVCFPPFCAGLAPRKNCPLPVLQHMFICRYTCIDFKNT
jgi:hypothetical protein